MGIWFYQVTNMKEHRAIVKYGAQPNKNGPNGNGYSVLLHNGSATPDWCIGFASDPVVIGTKLKGRYSFKFYDGDWDMTFEISVDGGKSFVVGKIKILANYARFNVYIYGDRLVISNDDQKLGRESDKVSFRYFLVSIDGIEPSNTFPSL